jgi:hypothetical protein
MERETIIPLTQRKGVVPDLAIASNGGPLSGGSADAPLSSQEVPPSLDAVVHRLRELIGQEQAINWDQGSQVNVIDDASLGLTKGYKSTRDCLTKELGADKSPKLYRSSIVARHYSKENTVKWGVSNLHLLAALQRKTHGAVQPGDPGEQEVLVPQDDGSVLVTAFRNCSFRDLRKASKHQKQIRKAGPKAEAKAEAVAGKLPSYSVWRALGMLALGTVVSFIGESLSFTSLGVWIELIGWGLLFAGTADLIRSAVAHRDRWIAALKKGDAIALIKEEARRFTSVVHKIIPAIRSVTLRTRGVFTRTPKRHSS